MAKTWVLDTETKGTGANMVPLEKVLDDSTPRAPVTVSKRAATSAAPRPPKRPVQKASSPLPPGHVRKKATGELGRVQDVDPRTGTVTVMWLRQGQASTVPLASVTRS